MLFSDRREAGLELANMLEQRFGSALVNNSESVVIAIPRGGVETGDAVAQYLGIGMDVVVSRKVGAPYNSELAIGAVTPDGRFYANEDLIEATGATKAYIEEQVAVQKKEIERRLYKFRGSTEYNLKGRTVVLVDDGVATGATILAAVEWLKKLMPKRLIVAVPVGSISAMEALKSAVADVVSLYTPASFEAVGQFYSDFAQVEDDQVVQIMKKYRHQD
ncbi:MAG: phosphoribosyltransferase family protein [Nitrososphaera sp.]